MLRVKRLPFDTFRENTAVLSRHCTDLRPERLKGFRKFEIDANGARRRNMLALVMIAEDDGPIARY
ncbi:MAG: thymidine phosphorylase, partial [Alphaproteobacteria bacterium]|nr:thymidine phosphorylase [Alphaproteobacteria bacterium]